MKTKEEIEQLGKQSAQKKYRLQHIPLEQIDEYGGEIASYVSIFSDAYTQCQEDMADKIEQAIEYGYQLRCNHKPINSGIDWVKEFNLINKQDNEK